MGNIATEFRPWRVVDTADVANPSDASSAIPTNGYSAIELEITLAGTTPEAVVQPIWWDATAKVWRKDPGEAKTFTGVGTYAYQVESRATALFLLVTTLTGTNPVATVRYSKIRKRSFV